MNVVNTVKKWLQSNPVRTLVYPIVGIVSAWLVTQGIADQNTADIIMSVVTLLGGGAATEGARALVWSPASVATLKKALTPPTPPTAS